MSKLVGARVRRVEDPRILTGRGTYVDDMHVPGMLHAAFCRSPHAHAVLESIDSAPARALPGVIAVFTAAEFVDRVSAMQPIGPKGHHTPPYGPLASDRVRFVGDPIAIVVATSRAIAEDACELIDATYSPLAPVVSIADALDSDKPVVFESAGTNTLYNESWDYGDVDDAFAAATHVIAHTFRLSRMTNAPMESRAAIADYRPAAGELIYHAAHQNPHALRVHLAQLLSIDAHKVRVICRDIGGSFGQKAYISREDVALAAASLTLGRPVKWIEDRVENLMTAGHARDEQLDAEIAVDAEGTILGARLHMFTDQGSYQLTTLPTTAYSSLVRIVFPNAYRIRNFHFESTVVATNKATVVAYRGPWAAETWVRERLLQLVARAVGVEPHVIRRRNLLTKADLPTEMVTGPTISNLTAYETHERALEHVDVAAFRVEQQRLRGEGRYLGFGMATFMEHAPGPPNFSAAMGASASPRSAQRAVARLEPDGTLTVFTSQMPHGQSHQTTLAQLAADQLGVDLDKVRIVAGDTARTPFNLVGTGGSRAARLGSGAVIGAAREVRDRVARIYAHMKEVAVADVVLTDGEVMVRGVPASAVPLATIAATGYTTTGSLPPDMSPGFECSYDFGIPDGGWAQATHCCWVEVDIATGEVQILRYFSAEDCGEMINPAIVEGQVRGGIVQGIGNVLFERVVYDGDGQFLTTTFMDYLIPGAVEMPSIECDHLESPPEEPVDHRGVGEGGAVGAPAALTNAIEDALAPFAVTITDQYLPPSRILELIGTI